MRLSVSLAALASFTALTISPPVAGAEGHHYPSAEQLERQATHREKLVKSITDALEEGKPAVIGSSLYDAIGKYEGDPTEILKDYVKLLADQNSSIRCVAAEAFLYAGFKKEEAVSTLMAVMEQSQREMTVLQGKQVDVRTFAAKALGVYGVKEAADGMWARYQEDHDDKLLFYLAEMEDPRPVSVILPMLSKAGKPSHYADVLGRLHCEEAKGALEKEHVSALDHFKNERALYWITGDESYLDDLISNASRGGLSYLVQIKSPKVEALLKEALRADKTQVAEAALVALHVNYPDDPAVRQVVVDFLTEKTLGYRMSSEFVYRIGVDLRDPEIDKLGTALDDRTQEGHWAPFLARRNFPLLDERMRAQ